MNCTTDPRRIRTVCDEATKTLDRLASKPNRCMAEDDALSCARATLRTYADLYGQDTCYGCTHLARRSTVNRYGECAADSTTRYVDFGISKCDKYNERTTA